MTVDHRSLLYNSIYNKIEVSVDRTFLKVSFYVIWYIVCCYIISIFIIILLLYSVKLYCYNF